MVTWHRHECFSVILFCKAYLYKITKTLDYFFILYLHTLYCVCTYFNHILNHKNRYTTFHSFLIMFCSQRNKKIYVITQNPLFDNFSTTLMRCEVLPRNSLWIKLILIPNMKYFFDLVYLTFKTNIK